MEFLVTWTLAWQQLPLWYQLGWVALCGAIVASFSNVVAYRLHTNASLNGRSRCFSCGHTLRWFDLLPVASYTLLRGRCRYCQARIPARDLIVELLFAALFVAAYLVAASISEFLLLVFLISLLSIIALYDLAHYIIPNELVLLLAVVSIGVWVSGWPLTVSDISQLLLSVTVAAGLYAGLWWYSGGRWLGFGDVKLAAALAPLLTLEQAFSMLVLSFWIGAAVGVAVVYLPHLWRRLRQRGQASVIGFKSEIPFAPFIVAAFLVVYMYDVSVFALFTW